MALWLWATVDGVGSARQVNKLCEQHLAYRWLCGGVSMNIDDRHHLPVLGNRNELLYGTAERNCSTTSRNLSTKIGFAIYPSQPPWRKVSSSPRMANAVTAMIGIEHSSSSSLIRLVTSS